jgi:hypothetical protein
MTTVKNYLHTFFMVIIVGEIDSLHRNHEIYLVLHDLRFQRDDRFGRQAYSSI